MKPIDQLSVDVARHLHGLLFDLDDTLLDGGRLSEAAYGSLFRLREAGLELVAVTGRPLGWAVVIARQWPVLAVVAENGALAARCEGELVERIDPVAAEERRRRRIRLASMVAEVQERFPVLVPADDVDARFSDFAFDIGERRHVPRETVAEAANFARLLGARTTTSSVHLHLTLDGDDKASGTVRLLRQLTKRDATHIRFGYAFIGDSENDSACFAAFGTTIGVANLRGQLTVPPRFITRGARGHGFAEAAQVLVDRRTPTVAPTRG